MVLWESLFHVTYYFGDVAFGGSMHKTINRY